MKNTVVQTDATKGSDTAKPVNFEPETVGREYEFTTWGMLSRRIGGDGTWYGRSNYKTEKAALDALAQVTSHSDTFDIGGITCRFVSPKRDTYEYKIVRYEQKATVLKTNFATV